MEMRTYMLMLIGTFITIMVYLALFGNFQEGLGKGFSSFIHLLGW